ncbi:hybrid sensor histidine kinase/response regulator [Gracilibacillus oryzae]|nr:ATP-binding protein [Gracilibacillus oryzae]
MVNKQVMSKTKIFMILLLFISLLVTFRIIWINYHQNTANPTAENGVLDLRNIELNKDTTIALNGEWYFYPNEFISNNPDDADKQFITVPGDWSETLDSNHPISAGYGYGSYRLTVLLPETDQNLYGLRINNIHTAANIIVNGSKEAKLNQPAANQIEPATFRGPYTALFYSDNNQLEIIIQVSNYEIPFFCGINESITFGTEEAILHETNTLEFLQLVVIVIFLLHAFYAFTLVLLGRGKSQKELIYFGFMLLLLASGNLIDDEVFIQLPFDTAFSFRFLMFIFILTLYVLIKFIHHLYRTNTTFIKILTISNIVLSVLTLFIFPFHYFVYLVMALYLYYFISISYMFMTTLKHIRNGDNNAIFILLFICSYTSNIIWGAAIQTGQIEFPFYPFDFFISIVLIAILLFRRHIHLVELTEEQTAKLVEEDKKKDQFLANTSHEIRNPLHGIINIAQSILINNDQQLDNETKNNLNLLIQIGHQLTLTLNDILDITRLKESKLQLNKQMINLPQLTTVVIEMVQFLSENKKITIKNEISSSFPLIEADENRMIRILFNLIHNAVKFTDTGSVTVNANKQKEFAIISVKDTGIGISDADLERIFLPYEKLSKMEVDSGGIGLGLNICRQMIELHGGEISVHSEVGKGTTFTFSIPLAINSTNHQLTQHTETIINQADSSLLPEADNYVPGKNTDPSILVIDDDPINLKVIQNLLGSSYQVVTTTRPEAAVNKINEKSWDLIITDVMMPKISGYELTRRIRTKYKLSELPILLLTARNQPEDIYSGFRAGANDYITKPVDALELQARVQALTDLKRSVNEQLRMEAAWLQAQIKPHFIFNTLNTIASLSTFDAEKMTELLNEFGNYLYRSFDIKNTLPLVPLSDELELVRSYVYINKKRFDDRVNVMWEVDDNINIEIPPLSIQTLVENAIKHGILKQMNGGVIWIKIIERSLYYQIEVIDNGVGCEESKIAAIVNNDHSHNGIGLTNTNNRLKKLFGKGLSISSKLGEGTKVSFQIPKSSKK